MERIRSVDYSVAPRSIYALLSLVLCAVDLISTGGVYIYDGPNMSVYKEILYIRSIAIISYICKRIIAQFYAT